MPTSCEPIIHPTNRVWPGTPQTVALTVQEAFDLGLERGATWPRDESGWQHVPGGPWIGSSGRKSGFAALFAHDLAVHEAWMRGWRAGFEAINGDDPPDWYKKMSRYWNGVYGT